MPLICKAPKTPGVLDALRVPYEYTCKKTIEDKAIIKKNGRVMKTFFWIWNTTLSLAPYLIFMGFGVLCWRWFEFANQSQFSLVEPIINGVIGGIVTSVLILIFSVIWRSNITPWLENLLYKDTKIEGIWQGVLVPFVGIDEIDKRRIKIAFGIIERRRKRKEKPEETTADTKTLGQNPVVVATAQEKYGRRDIEAELIIKSVPDDVANADQDELIDRRLFIKIGSNLAPIEVRVEIKRVGHAIAGQIVEIGGASDIHTYRLSGSFKNLILTGEYENQDCAHIDRGGLSLMLRGNGQSLEGFFSSYVDEDHKMAPFKCVLKRLPRDTTDDEV
jgi:hypothetical protein